MKRIIATVLASLVAATAVFAQTTIDKPVATATLIRKDVISQRQFRADVEKTEAALGRKFTLDERKQIVEDRIDYVLFLQYCEREKIAVSEADVLKGLAAYKQQVQQQYGVAVDDAALEKLLRSQGAFVDAKSFVKQNLLFNLYVQQKKSAELAAVKDPSADDILKFYDLQKASLVRPDTAKVSILYVDFRNLSEDAKKKGIDALRQASAQLKSNPGKFDELVLRTSDPSSAMKSSINFEVQKRTESVQAWGQTFVDQVFKMKAGEISDVIENENGIQLIRVNEVLPQKLLTLSDPYPGIANATVQDAIRYLLVTNSRNTVIAKIKSDLHNELRKAAKIDYMYDNLNW